MIKSRILKNHPLNFLSGSFFNRLFHSTQVTTCLCPCCTSEIKSLKSFWLYKYYKCPICKSYFVHPRPTPEEYSNRLDTIVSQHLTSIDFENFYPHYKRHLLDTCLMELRKTRNKDISPESVSLLDYGCGVGRLLYSARIYYS